VAFDSHFSKLYSVLGDVCGVGDDENGSLDFFVKSIKSRELSFLLLPRNKVMAMFVDGYTAELTFANVECPAARSFPSFGT